ncbi:hypothetical protein [Paenibacillus sp. UNC496MF]|uniref:hypothetical protein n=1 Tax=Paenibacillus sp. UNC496MF TaxID=1502753 RepID=UPI001C42EF51|nr:hypothetical protein [Paenibacillus sp. UNC496MF]
MVMEWGPDLIARAILMPRISSCFDGGTGCPGGIIAIALLLKDPEDPSLVEVSGAERSAACFAASAAGSVGEALFRTRGADDFRFAMSSSSSKKALKYPRKAVKSSLLSVCRGLIS